MKHKLKYLFLLAAAIFVAYVSYSQEWTKQPSKAKRDSTFAKYAWKEHDDVHGEGGKIILLRNGRFRYSAYGSGNFQEHSAGIYRIKKDTLILASDLQSDNIKVALTYVEGVGNDTLYSRLLFPLTKDGDTLFNTYYFLNNDTSFNGHYDPLKDVSLLPFL